jgi:hypothetical protein
MCLPKEAVNLSLESLIFFSRILRVKRCRTKLLRKNRAQKQVWRKGKMKHTTAIILSILMVGLMATQTRSQVPSNLVGKWFSGSASILQEKNMTTGAVASRYGSSIGYEINADGTFQYAGLMKSTMYGCTTTLWNDQRGKISIEGDRITFAPSKDYWLNTNSCYPSANKEKNKELQAKTYNFEVGTKEGKEWLCMREVGKTDVKDITCYPRSND